MEDSKKFEVVVLGIIFDPAKKQVLLGKRNGYHITEGSSWHFPGGVLNPGEDIDKALKDNIKRKTGYSVKNIGTFFSRTYEESESLVSIYFLTEVFEGAENPGEDITELKWVNIKDLDEYFETPMHKKLREFLFELI